jgi:hypothetical protein
MHLANKVSLTLVLDRVAIRVGVAIVIFSLTRAVAVENLLLAKKIQ